MNILQSTPTGYSTVCPYLVVSDVKQQLDFIRTIFAGDIIEEMKGTDGGIMHGEIRLGNSVIMVGRASDTSPKREFINYIFVADVDATFEKARQNQAELLEKPQDQFYGHRTAAIADAQGNQWWFAQVIEDLSTAEIEQRMRGKD